MKDVPPRIASLFRSLSINLLFFILVSASPCVRTNAPILLWPTRVDPGGLFCFRVNLTNGVDTGWVCLVNQPFPGLYTYANSTFPLIPGESLNFTVEEMQMEYANGTVPTPFPSWLAYSGSFCVDLSLESPVVEALAEFSSTNFSTILSNGLASILDRVQPSGFMPTSISGGYGGIVNMFVRDTCAMLIAMMEENCDTCFAKVSKVLNFTLSAERN